MTKRIFTDAERKLLARKPGCLAEAGRIGLNDERIAELTEAVEPAYFNEPGISPMGGLSGLEEALRAAGCGDPDGPVELLALDGRTGRVYLVNTEGYAYARYLGVVAER